MGKKEGPPPTCPKCWGRRTVAKTTKKLGADEKGLPITIEMTTIGPCDGCGGKGTK